MRNLSSNKFTFFVIFFWLLGFALNTISYLSIEPIILSIIFYYFGLLVVKNSVLQKNINFESIAYKLTFPVMWFAAGIAAVYANYLNDPSQLHDAIDFYNFATSSEFNEFSLTDFQRVTEGSGVIIIWRSVYDFMAILGFSSGMYIGILVNILFVSFASVLAVKIGRLAYGNDVYKIKAIIVLFLFCGMYWLFSAVYLRDAAILFFVTTLSYLWTRYINQANIFNLIIVIMATIIMPILFVYLRAELYYAPFAFLLAGISALLAFSERSAKKMIVMIFIGVLIISFLYIFQEELHSFGKILTEGNRQYAEVVQSNTSLGYIIVINQPIYIRSLIAPFYLFLSPIPFWSGLLHGSVYHLFKSMNTVFFYFVLPLILLSTYKLFTHKVYRSPVIMFHAFITFGFVLAVSLTSLEGRHIGVFLVSAFILAVLADIANSTDRNRYEIILFIYLILVFMIHVAWSLKFFLI